MAFYISGKVLGQVMVREDPELWETVIDQGIFTTRIKTFRRFNEGDEIYLEVTIRGLRHSGFLVITEVEQIKEEGKKNDFLKTQSRQQEITGGEVPF